MFFPKWTVGFAPLAALFLSAVSFQFPQVESELAARAGALARAAGAAASVEGRDVTLAAPGLDPAALEQLRGALAALDGIRRVLDGPAPEQALAPARTPEPAPSLPLVDLFTLDVERTADGLFVSGHAPSAADRDALMEALRTAAMPGALTGAVQLAAGAPGAIDYQNAARFIAVQASRLASGRAGMRGDLFSISGETPDAAALAALRAAVGGVLPGGLRLAGMDVRAVPPPPPPAMKPYVFSAERSAAGLTLTGAAPSPEVRTLLVEAARALASDVTDRAALASGEPRNFAAIARHGVALLANLARGRFTLTDSVYSVEGETADFASYDAIRAALASLPEGAAPGVMEVAAPALHPYRFEAAREGDGLVLRGGFPDEAARAAALELGRKLFPGLAIRDEARTARGAPAGYGDIVRAALTALAQMSAGGVSFSGGALSLSGATDAARDAMAGALQALLPAGVSLDMGTLRAAPPPPQREAAAPGGEGQGREGAAPAPAWTAPSCTAGASAQATVFFDPARAVPQPRSQGDMEAIARFLASCEGARAMVAGHTDGAGSRARNLRLSGARARAVARSLRQAGAPARTISFTFHAADKRAAAPEASAADRARNRRVEILVLREAR